MKTQLLRNDPIHDTWWDNQEKMTKRMSRSAQKVNPQASVDEFSLAQSSLTSAEMNSLEEGMLAELNQENMTSMTSSKKKSVKFDPTLPQPWDEDTPLGRALKKVRICEERKRRARR